MKVYLAGRYSIRDQLKDYRETLQMLGHEVTSRWLDFEDENPEHFDFEDDGTASSHAAPPVREHVAQMDVDDCEAADVIMLFTAELGRRGGMFVEWGIGIAHRKVLVCVGPQVNVFQHFPGTNVFADFNDALDHIDQWGEKWQIFGVLRHHVEANKTVASFGLRGKTIEPIKSGQVAEIDVMTGRVRIARKETAGL